jgi:hypothetical protein
MNWVKIIFHQTGAKNDIIEEQFLVGECVFFNGNKGDGRNKR